MNVKNSLLKIRVKDILKFLAVLWIIFIGYKGYQFPMSKPAYDVDGITFGLGLYKAVAFPAVMYLILSARPRENNIKIILVSLITVMILNNMIDLKFYGSIGGLGGFLIIYIPIGIIVSIINIISYLRKRKLKKYLEKDYYVENECNNESNETLHMEKISTDCNKCGYENKEGAKFCNQCGSKIEQNQNKTFGMMEEDKKTSLNSIIVRHKKKSIIGLIVVVISIICYIGYFNYGIGMPEQQKNDRINALVLAKEYNEARSMNDVYFKETDKATILIHDLHKSVIDTCEVTNTGNLAEATDKYNQLKNTVKIIKTEIVNFKYSTNYQTIKVTVQNNSKENLSYVKIGLDFKDKNGKVIQSDWTNSDSVIKPGATQTLEKMVSKDVKYDTVHSEVLDFK
ncbi:zinc-ribbon domain-containing protein [Clostridium saccharoperbutylacetonicum]